MVIRKNAYKSVSVIMPVYNERPLIATILRKVVEADTAGLAKEIIIVDDGSTDGTTAVLRRLHKKYLGQHVNMRLLLKPENEGKGASLRKGFGLSKGDIILVQDADLEYDPKDYPQLLKPLINGQTRVVYGSRMLSPGPMQHGGLHFFIGGQFINWLTNRLYRLNLTDEATGYKVFQATILDEITLRCIRFEFCPELTAKLAKRSISILEVPVSYRGRTIQEGKKIHWRDGFEAILILLKYRLVS